MNLKDILDSATPGPWLPSYSGNFVVTEDALVIAETGTYQMPKENARLIALAPELAAEVLELRERHREAMALVLDMGEHIREHGFGAESDALLARLDQIGAADETRLGKEQT